VKPLSRSIFFRPVISKHDNTSAEFNERLALKICCLNAVASLVTAVLMIVWARFGG
jgi:hypothetical protein